MFLSLLENRRSVRRFLNRPVEKEKIDILMEAALRSPSSRNREPWEFVVVNDGEMLQKLSRAKEHGSAFLEGAPLAVVVCADPSRCDVWVEDCSIAAIILQLTAESLDLGSCWSQIRLRGHAGGGSAEDYVKEILALPDGHVVEAIIGIGYPAERLEPRSRDDLDCAKVHYGKY